MTKRSMSPARKRRLWQAAKGLCEVCGEPVDMLGPAVRYDHRIPIWISEDDSDENLRPIHRKNCDETKTPKDQGDIAKVKRLIAKREGTTRRKHPIPNRGFDNTLTRGFDGRVRERKTRK